MFICLCLLEPYYSTILLLSSASTPCTSESRGSSCRSTETACSRSSSYRTEPRRRPSSSRTGCSCPCCSYSVKPASTMGAGWGETLTNWPRTRGRCSARRFLDWYRTTCIRPYRMVMRSKKETRERERESQCRSTHTHTHRERERERALLLVRRDHTVTNKIQ